jgi:hypothetical protein
MSVHTPIDTPANPARYQKTPLWSPSYTETGTRPVPGRQQSRGGVHSMGYRAHTAGERLGMGTGDPLPRTVQIAYPKEEEQAQHVGHRTV